jgi:hypothetical protein
MIMMDQTDSKSILRKTIQDELHKLKADLAIHKQQVKELWRGDSDMLSLLKSEEGVLVKEIAHLEQELRETRH